MEKLNNNIISAIKNKAYNESEMLEQLLYKKNLNSSLNYQQLTAQEKLQHKTIYSNEELDFVINNYQHKFRDNELLKSCIYLLEEFKQTNQTSKCSAVYTILNKYFTIVNCHNNHVYYPEWDGFTIINFVKCPLVLKELIIEKALQIKSDKQKQLRTDYKQKADKSDKEIIAELEL